MRRSEAIIAAKLRASEPISSPRDASASEPVKSPTAMRFATASMSDSNKKKPISPQEIARRKEAAQKQADLLNTPTAKSYSTMGGKNGKFAPKKAQNFRHQGR